MTNQEAIDKMEFCKRAYQRLIDENSQEGVFVGKGFEGKWKADTPLYKVYEDMRDACDMSIKALKQEPCGDAISRKEVHDLIAKLLSDYLHDEDREKIEKLDIDIEELLSVNPQEPKYCDRNICISNEYNGISCKECEVTKSQEPLEVEATELQKAYNKGFNNCKQMVLVKKELVELEDGQSFYCISPEDVETLLPVNPKEPKTGHWIRWYEKKENDGYTENIPHCKCSECDTEYDSYSSQFIKYCNECGAKMEEQKPN